MAIKDVSSKCWILALFVRDDGERLLLGDGSYEFNEKQLHFVANTMANDVVEVQGNDGYMLAGQVRRPSTQTFDGYVGDSSTSKAVVEERRRAFFAFFRKDFFYKVIYVFPDGSAIQRKRGFLVDAPEVKEIRQIYPEYHVALNFEDINYYYYDEDEEGEEIYGKSATISLNSVAQSGGLVWLLPTEVTLTGEGSEFTLDGTVHGTVLTSVGVKGDTFQQAYSGWQLVKKDGMATASSDSDFWLSLTLSQQILENGYAKLSNTSGSQMNFGNFFIQSAGVSLEPSTTYTVVMEIADISGSIDAIIIKSSNSADPFNNTFSTVFHPNGSVDTSNVDTVSFSNLVTGKYVAVVNTKSNATNIGFRGYVHTASNNSYITLRLSIIKGDHTSDWQNYDWQPYVGGIPSPNPDYPQEVQTATGQQVVTVLGNGGQGQEYEVNLGKNLMPYPYFHSTGRVSNGITFTVNDNGSITLNGQNNGSGNSTFILAKNGNDYIAGKYYFIPISNNAIHYTWYDGSVFKSFNQSNGFSQIFASTTNANEVYVEVNSGNTTSFTDYTIYPMLTIIPNQTEVDYAPYFTPIELCKIGDYQDRIYKSDGEWYVRKEIGKAVFNGSEAWSMGNSGTPRFYYQSALSPIAPYGTNTTTIRSNYGTGAFVSNENTLTGIMITNTGGTVRVRYGTELTVSEWQTKLGATNMLLYYPLNTPTDTQITNTALIAQLETLASATTYNGSTTFTVDGSGNLAAILAVEVEASTGGGVEWDEDGAVWEEGTPNYSVISVDSIDNVYPVLTITGRTVNPVLTDVTTGKIFSYNGTITESQVLRVDMMNKTATLNGVSVIGNVTGDWLYLAPGNNRITYTADNTDAPNATVEWQEIVG